MLVRDPADSVRSATEPEPSFRLAEQLPHSVTDALFDDATLSRALDAFPRPDAVSRCNYDNQLQPGSLDL